MLANAVSKAKNKNIESIKGKIFLNKKGNLQKNKVDKVKLGIFGLTFKPDIDDLRESPALYVVDNLLGLGFDVSVVEPNITKLDNYDNMELDSAINTSDLIVVLVGHKEFLTDAIRHRLLEKNALDFCGILNDLS